MANYRQSALPFSAMPRIFITLKCNFNCSYCVVEKPTPRHDNLSPEKWIEIINALPGDGIVFTGGEPTLLPHLPQIINEIDKPDVRLYTNVSASLEYWDCIQRPVRVVATFHPGQKLSAVFIAARLAALRDIGHQVHNPHIVAAPNTSSDELWEFSKRDIPLRIDPNLHMLSVWKKRDKNICRAVCSIPRIYIGPDGKRYPCVRKMVEFRDSISHMNLGGDYECGECGNCHICDSNVLEIKTTKPGRGGAHDDTFKA